MRKWLGFVFVAFAVVLSTGAAFAETPDEARAQIADWRAQVETADCPGRLCFWGKIAMLSGGVYRALEAACDAHDRACADTFVDALMALRGQNAKKNAEIMRMSLPLPPMAQRTAACGGDQSCKDAFQHIAAALKDDGAKIRSAAKAAHLVISLSPKASEADAMAYIKDALAEIHAGACPLTTKLCAAGTIMLLDEIDQITRNENACLAAAGDAQKACFDRYGDAMEMVDGESSETLLRITSLYGWPNATDWGLIVEDRAWLLAQHADEHPERQRAFLAMMQASWRAGKSLSQDYAYLVDRVSIAQWHTQIYGTQGHCETHDGRNAWVPDTLQDSKHLDRLRDEIGLPDMTHYKAMVTTLCVKYGD